MDELKKVIEIEAVAQLRADAALGRRVRELVLGESRGDNLYSVVGDILEQGREVPLRIGAAFDALIRKLEGERGS